MSRSDFSPARWLAALLLLAAGFLLLLFALLMDQRYTPDPYGPTPTPMVSNGHE
jgi:hypothetical protein